MKVEAYVDIHEIVEKAGEYETLELVENLYHEKLYRDKILEFFVQELDSYDKEEFDNFPVRLKQKIETLFSKKEEWL